MQTRGKQKARQQRDSAREELFKALSHDLRVEILTFLNDHGVASPAQIAKALGSPVPLVNHHVKQLVKWRCAEPAGERKSKGKQTIEHFYRATARPLLSDEQWAQMAPAAKDAFSRQIIGTILRDLEKGFAAGTIDKRTDRHMSRTPLSLDEEGWRNVQAIHERALDEILDEQAKSNGRRSKSGEDPINAMSAQLCVEIPSA